MSFSIEREPPWFFPYIESYYHLFLDIKFDKLDTLNERMYFSMDIDIKGFEGVLFYIYKPNQNKILFDILNHKTEIIHSIKNLYIDLEDQRSSTSLDFIFIPFGHFREINKFTPIIKSGNVESTYQIFRWIPSTLFKNVKSIIKIANRYDELIPFDDYEGYYFTFDNAFKGNKTEYLFNLINLLCKFDNVPNMEPMVLEIKTLINKTNEYLFELTQKSIPIETQNLLKELERLKYNIDNLSKEEIFNWIDNLIDYYSGQF
ncbi:MAG: hypothetical protein ACFFD5_05940 [Candidatus Thorarchaeota archaeon]